MLRQCAALMFFAAFAAPALAQGEAAQGETETPAQSAAWHNAQQAALASRAAEPGWQTIDGGLLWRRVAGGGSGAHPAASDVVTVHYAGTFVDGQEFDSSYRRGQPATFPLTGLIPAWRLAIPQMGVGDTIEIAAPATLAYGAVSRGPIPGGATLLFTVELIDILGK